MRHLTAEPVQTDCTRVVYLVRSQLDLMKYICLHIKDDTSKGIEREYFLYFVPRRSVVCEKVCFSVYCPFEFIWLWSDWHGSHFCFKSFVQFSVVLDTRRGETSPFAHYWWIPIICSSTRWRCHIIWTWPCLQGNLGTTFMFLAIWLYGFDMDVLILDKFCLIGIFGGWGWDFSLAHCKSYSQTGGLLYLICCHWLLELYERQTSSVHNLMCINFLSLFDYWFLLGDDCSLLSGWFQILELKGELPNVLLTFWISCKLKNLLTLPMYVKIQLDPLYFMIPKPSQPFINILSDNFIFLTRWLCQK